MSLVHVYSLTRVKYPVALPRYRFLRVKRYPTACGREFYSRGFTLIEILVVLALLGLIASMLPQGLTGLYAKSSHQALVQKILVAARECTVVAQQRQRSVRLGSRECPLPPDSNEVDARELLPVFHADGTASHTAHIIVEGETGANIKRIVIVIDKLTANASVNTNAR